MSRWLSGWVIGRDGSLVCPVGLLFAGVGSWFVDESSLVCQAGFVGVFLWIVGSSCFVGLSEWFVASSGRFDVVLFVGWVGFVGWIFLV